MAERKNKSPFSIYWIYAIIGIAIIAFQLFMSGSGKAKINTKQTFFTLVEKKGVEKVRIINRERVEFQLNQTGKQFSEKIVCSCELILLQMTEVWNCYTNKNN